MFSTEFREILEQLLRRIIFGATSAKNTEEEKKTRSDPFGFRFPGQLFVTSWSNLLSAQIFANFSYHSNPYLVPVFYVPTCFTYFCAYLPSYFTCPCVYVIHFYALCCLCLYALRAFVVLIRQDYLLTLRFLKWSCNVRVVFLVPIFVSWFFCPYFTVISSRWCCTSSNVLRTKEKNILKISWMFLQPCLELWLFRHFTFKWFYFTIFYPL